MELEVNSVSLQKQQNAFASIQCSGDLFYITADSFIEVLRQKGRVI